MGERKILLIDLVVSLALSGGPESAYGPVFILHISFLGKQNLSAASPTPVH